MRAVVLQSEKSVEIVDYPHPEVKAHDVLLRLSAAAINRRDFWIQQGLYPGLTPPVVLGSDGVGEVIEVGSAVDQQWLNQKCLINPSEDWGPDERAQNKEFKILGNPRDGTFAEFIAIPADRLALAPNHLSDEEAAALPLAGLTAYRALVKRAKVQANERVLITGFGGGVAQMAFHFAKVFGCQVVVTSSHEAKRESALKAGALHAYDYRRDDWTKQLKQDIGGFDVAIDGSGGPAWSDLIKVADFGARIAIYGATAGDSEGLPLRQVFWKQLSLLGSTMGSDQDFADMLDFVIEHRIPVSVDKVFSLDDAIDALEYVGSAQQMGKVVLRCDGKPQS